MNKDKKIIHLEKKSCHTSECRGQVLIGTMDGGHRVFLFENGQWSVQKASGNSYVVTGLYDWRWLREQHCITLACWNGYDFQFPDERQQHTITITGNWTDEDAEALFDALGSLDYPEGQTEVELNKPEEE